MVGQLGATHTIGTGGGSRLSGGSRPVHGSGGQGVGDTHDRDRAVPIRSRRGDKADSSHAPFSMMRRHGSGRSERHSGEIRPFGRGRVVPAERKPCAITRVKSPTVRDESSDVGEAAISAGAHRSGAAREPRACLRTLPGRGLTPSTPCRTRCREAPDPTTPVAGWPWCSHRSRSRSRRPREIVGVPGGFSRRTVGGCRTSPTT